MCTTCGCSDGATVTVTDPDAEQAHQSDGAHAHTHGHDHEHGHAHSFEHAHPHAHAQTHGRTRLVDARPAGRTVLLEQEVLAKNNLLAERNRGWLEGRGILALNLTSSPGAGKTTLLERTIRDLGKRLPLSVIEGDQETTRDAERIRATGCRVVQVNTGSGCHLDADMLARSLRALDPPMRSLLMIENVGNLVCPALFDLGERSKVVIMSVTEGEDKPLKYPHMFRASEVMILNKIDLLPHLEFDVDKCLGYARQVHPELRFFQLSATRGDGLAAWYGWLESQMARLPAYA